MSLLTRTIYNLIFRHLSARTPLSHNKHSHSCLVAKISRTRIFFLNMSLRELIKDKWIPFLDDEVDLEELAANHLSADAPSDGPANWVQIVQSAHRLRLIESWLRRDDGAIDIASLCDRVLEAGCGQGDQTAALAAIMRKYPGLQQSVIHGVDPGPPDYGGSHEDTDDAQVQVAQFC